MSHHKHVAFVCLMVALALTGTASSAFGEEVIAWNDLGMHCMDSDYSVFSILPPYNTLCAQVIGPDGLISDSAGLTVTYEAVADPSGSINTSSVGKTDFWEHVLSLFGVELEPDQGLGGFVMPGVGNQPQAMVWDAEHQWFVAEGIPITPYDDEGFRRSYPMMRVTVRNASGQAVATTDVVLPVADEMDCSSCHGSGSGAAARPSEGWADDPNPDTDYRRNILRLHDDFHGGSSRFQSALAAAGYSSSGLEATVAAGTAVLCARCHASNALPGTGLAGIPPLTTAIHGYHAHVIDPNNGQTLDASDNRGACYTCHPGSETRCLRGAMGSAVAPDGSLAIQCQSCHGSISRVGSADREGWLDQPDCGSCHTGTATVNSGQIRYDSVFTAGGEERVPADRTFTAAQPGSQPPDSLYRFSSGHGGLACAACHGSTHAEFPSSHTNDNLQSIRLQGQEGTISDCTTCHEQSPSTVTGGPHGMHPVGQVWVERHEDAAEDNPSACKVCHGDDYRGTELSRALGDRTINAFGGKTFWRGYQIGCYTCHNGPHSDDSNSNHPPTVLNRSATTTHDTPVTIALGASDSDGNSISLRIVQQAHYGTVALSGTSATYMPDAGFGGNDSFTYAAWDGEANSNLAVVTLTVTPAELTASITASPPMGVAPLTVYFDGRGNGGLDPLTYHWDFGDGGISSALPQPTHIFENPGSYTVTLTVVDGDENSTTANQTITITELDTTFRYLIPGVAHNHGAESTLWRTDVAAVNLAESAATVTATLRSSSSPVSATATVAAGGAIEWRNVVEVLLGADPNSEFTGALELVSDQQLFANARTFNDTPFGTYGQSMPVLTEADALVGEQLGILPQLRGGIDYRTNIGAVNLGDTEVRVRLQLFDGVGVSLGGEFSMVVPAGEWRQRNDVLAGTVYEAEDAAFATVELVSGGSVWVYASMIDARTGDPTTVGVNIQ